MKIILFFILTINSTLASPKILNFKKGDEIPKKCQSRSTFPDAILDVAPKADSFKNGIEILIGTRKPKPNDVDRVSYSKAEFEALIGREIKGFSAKAIIAVQICSLKEDKTRKVSENIKKLKIGNDF